MDSTAKPKDIVAKVKSLGQTAVALTDHGETSGLIEMYKECKKNGIHFVFGCEHYLVPSVYVKEKGYKHINFWAKNQVGYNNLLKLTTEAHGDAGRQPNNFYSKPRVDIDIIRKYSEGLVCSTACLGGWLRIKGEQKDSVNVPLLEQMLEIFGKDLWIELHTYSIDEQKQWNLKLIEIAKQYDIPMIAATDAHYVNKEDAYVHKQWLTQGKEREDGYYQHAEFYHHSEQEVREALSYLPSDIVETSIANTQILADSCQVEIEFGGQHYPKVDVPDEEKAIYDIIRKNWKKKLPDKSEWQVHKERVYHEMPILVKAKYPPYFLIMHDFVQACEDMNIALGYSRGSAGGCDVGYLMNIHKTNSVKYDLMFSRFLHEERITPCDIDVDVSRKRRGDCIEYLKNKYGHDRVFQARTYGYMAARGALQRAGKSLGYDPQCIKELSKGIPKFNADDEEEEFKGEAIEHHLLDQIATPEITDLISLSKSFVGILQSYSVHASAVIIFPDDPTNYTAIEKSKDNYVTAYEFHTLESLGILKLDVLGVKTTDVIQETIKLLDEKIDTVNLPPDDPKTFDMLCKGNTAGVFQLEGVGFTRLIKSIQPKHFEELAPLIGVYRPAIISAGLLETYINRSNGVEPVEYLHPDLEEILSPTLGIAIYQESIIEISKKICGYTAGQADVLRRAIGRKLPEEMQKIKPEFIQRAINNGYEKSFAEKLFEFVEFFAGYGMNKSHVYGYAWMAYVTAYLKANYPKEFMVSLINSEEAQKDIIPYINECKKLGIKVLPPDVTKKNEQWIIEGDAIRIGLHYIKKVGKNLDLSNVDSFADLVANNHSDVVGNLVKAGACDCYGQPRGVLLANINNLSDILSRRKECLENITKNEQLLNQATIDKDIRKYTRQLSSWKEKLAECESRQAVTESQTYDEAKGELETLGYTDKELPKIKSGVLMSISTILDKNKHQMAFLVFKTDYGEIKTTVFYKGWSLIKDKITKGGLYVFVVSDSGILEELQVEGQVYKTNERWDNKWKK
jgi:DNA polymerase-3 subunit alpha